LFWCKNSNNAAEAENVLARKIAARELAVAVGALLCKIEGYRFPGCNPLLHGPDLGYQQLLNYHWKSSDDRIFVVADGKDPVRENR